MNKEIDEFFAKVSSDELKELLRVAEFERLNTAGWNAVRPEDFVAWSAWDELLLGSASNVYSVAYTHLQAIKPVLEDCSVSVDASSLKSSNYEEMPFAA
jgi:hypothetical protein